MGLRRKGRIIAFQALYFWDVSHPQVEELLRFDWLDDAASGDESGEQSRTFARLILSGVLENIESVDDAIRRQLEHWDFSRLSWVDRAILRLSTYELLFTRDIPPSVTIDEAIGIAKEFGADDSFRFINGVLDAGKDETGKK